MSLIPQPQRSELKRLHDAGFSQFDCGADSLEELVTFPPLLSYIEITPDVDLYITQGNKIGTDDKYVLFYRDNKVHEKYGK